MKGLCTWSQRLRICSRSRLCSLCCCGHSSKATRTGVAYHLGVDVDDHSALSGVIGTMQSRSCLRLPSLRRRLKSQNGGGQWGGSLDIYSPTLASSFSSFQCAECVDYEPVFGGRVSASRRVRCMFVLRQPQLLVVSSLPPPSCFPFSSRFLDLRWQACPQPHSCCCVQLLQ